MDLDVIYSPRRFLNSREGLVTKNRVARKGNKKLNTDVKDSQDIKKEDKCDVAVAKEIERT